MVNRTMEKGLQRRRFKLNKFKYQALWYRAWSHIIVEFFLSRFEMDIQNVQFGGIQKT